MGNTVSQPEEDLPCGQPEQDEVALTSSADLAEQHESTGDHFDFNSTQQANPWQGTQTLCQRYPEPEKKFEAILTRLFSHPQTDIDYS
jgi:hypothetical protein